MKNSVNERLRDKLIANSMRLDSIAQSDHLQTFLSCIPDQLKAVLSSAQAHVGADSRRFDAVFPNPIGMVRDDEPPYLPSPDSEYRDTDSWYAALEMLKRFQCPVPIPAVLRFGHHLPTWEIKLCNYSQIIEDLTNYLANHKSTFFGWVSLDSMDGVVLTNYCGYLESDRKTNNEEMVYEVVNWGRVREVPGTDSSV